MCDLHGLSGYQSPPPKLQHIHVSASGLVQPQLVQGFADCDGFAVCYGDYGTRSAVAGGSGAFRPYDVIGVQDQLFAVARGVDDKQVCHCSCLP